MKTMERLIKRFNRLYPGVHAELDWINSYPGWYTVVITDNDYGVNDRYHFQTCNDFRDWMEGVVWE